MFLRFFHDKYAIWKLSNATLFFDEQNKLIFHLKFYIIKCLCRLRGLFENVNCHRALTSFLLDLERENRRIWM
jgi:hypothetical protein